MFILATISPPDLIIIFMIALVIFGPKKLPEVGRQVGHALREMRKLSHEFLGSITDVRDEVSGVGASFKDQFLNSDRHEKPPAPSGDAYLLDQSPVLSPPPVTVTRRGLSLSALPPEPQAPVEGEQ